jgi:hypothetical protein
MIVALLSGILYPYLERAWKCREPSSEACVWASAYFPMSRWLEPIIITPIAFLLLALLFRIVAHRRP